MTWRLALLVGWVAGVVGLLALDTDEGVAYIAGGPPFTVAVGAVVDRWWALLTPVVVTLGVIVVLLAEEPFGIVLVMATLVFAGPAALALALGIGLRRLGRRLARSEQHA